MRLVLDTNIVIAALQWHGKPHRLLDDDLLSLKTFRDIPIITSAQAMRIFAAA